jgi:hypothetical protein
MKEAFFDILEAFFDGLDVFQVFAGFYLNFLFWELNLIEEVSEVIF